MLYYYVIAGGAAPIHFPFIYISPGVWGVRLAVFDSDVFSGKGYHQA